MKKIGFLFGAGAEGKGQIGLPSGNDFKRDIILAKDVARYANDILAYSKSGIMLNSGTTLTYNSSSVLYQTMVERAECDESAMRTLFPENESYDSAIRYWSYKKKEIELINNSKNEKIPQEFKKLYGEKFFRPIHDDRKLPDSVNYFLKYAGIYSYLDSLFNFLRKPSRYPKECSRVLKVYYAAHKSIMNGLYECLGVEAPSRLIDCLSTQGENDIVECDSKRAIDALQDRIVEKRLVSSEGEKKDLYYYMIQKVLGCRDDCEISAITTNYTKFAEKILQLDRQRISYLHGELTLFEELETKKIGEIDSLDWTKTIFPYLLVQSGVKPIISPYQIEEFNKAKRCVEDSDYLIVIGYGANSDDEHIVNFLRWRLDIGKPIIYFIHDRDETDIMTKEKETEALIGKSEQLLFRGASHFEEEMRKIALDEKLERNS